MKINTDLVFRVERKITGANIHRVRNMLSLYGGAVFCFNSKKPDLGKKYWKEQVNKWEKKLQYFIATGDCKRNSEKG